VDRFGPAGGVFYEGSSGLGDNMDAPCEKPAKDDTGPG